MPTSGRFHLDTNIIIALFAGDPAVQRRMREAEEIFLSTPVLGELYFGARKSSRVEENVARVDQLMQRSTILPCDAQTAKIYGDIKAGLRAKGRSIPENDIWIASIVRQYGLILVTRDVHFGEIDSLQIERW